MFKIENLEKKIFFRVGVTKWQIFFLRFLAVSGHSESIQNFSGGGGADTE